MSGRDEPEGVGRTRRLQAMGGVLRNASSDETEDGWGEAEPTTDTSPADAALRREVPPHHGG